MVIADYEMYQSALALLERQLDQDEATTAQNAEAIDELVGAIMAYEEKHYPIPASSPEEAAEFRAEQEQP